MPADAILLSQPIETGSLFDEGRAGRAAVERRLEDDADARLDHVLFRLARALAPLGPVRHAALFRTGHATGAHRFRLAQHPAPEVVHVLRVVLRATHFTLFNNQFKLIIQLTQFIKYVINN